MFGVLGASFIGELSELRLPSEDNDGGGEWRVAAIRERERDKYKNIGYLVRDRLYYILREITLP